MRMLSWNCQELENSWTVRSLCKIVRDQAPIVCFLIETHLDKEGFQIHCKDIPFKNKLIVKKLNTVGGLALLWKADVQLDVINYTEHHFLAKVVEEDGYECSGDSNQMEEYLDTVQCKVTIDMIEILSSDYSAEEIKAAVFQIGPTKAPGPDVVYETLHAMHSRRSGRRGYMALKLDVSKAYDRVEWSFLRGIMSKLDLPECWIDREMSCVTSTSFSIRIDGKAYGNIQPSRGLRQGDPLSPYLFLLCAEGFSSMLAKAQEEERLHGVVICRRAPSISHLLFADDSLLFCKASQEEVQVISEVLQTYAASSGQCINFEKSSVYFSSNTAIEDRERIKEKMGVREVERFESYLKLPTLVGRAKYQTFSYLKDRVWKKNSELERIIIVKSWEGNSYKSSAQLPVKLCDELKACARFWWGQMNNERKIHWKSWNGLTQAKKEGGMGFRDLRNFNLAMLAKQGWRLLHEKESLVFRCFKAKYFPRGSFLEVTDVPNSSFVWKSLLVAQHILKKGCCWRVGDGRSIQVMHDKWIPNYPTNQVLHPLLEAEEDWISKVHTGLTCVAAYKNGVYSVKSGYYIARGLTRERNGMEESSGMRNKGFIWSRLWKLKLPSKIKVFGWRACQEIFPMKGNLARSRIVKDGMCELCKQETEMVLHVLWGCGVARDVWAGCKGRIQKRVGSRANFIHLFEEMMDKLEVEELELFLDPTQLVKCATDVLQEYHGTMELLAIQSSTGLVLKWESLVGSSFNINFDAAVFAEIDASGIGVIVQNDKVEAMAALSARGPPMQDSKEAEVLACQRAMAFTVEAGFTELVLEGDNSIVMKSINNSTLYMRI
ncbi:uncharacterized protein LOC112004058 [Quercus suber]|uniref:uncharacterized protein LOC112004058 n=1 Tax=Quercus suber TaxID=58331 RepID=UPI000CE1C83A|nr:uncharacterized protein LOC112004058 [Quercus suber]